MIALAVAGAAFGCQSFRSWEQCPGVYSGLRYYGDQVGELPFDGKLFFTFDLPLSLVMDTIAVPATAFADPREPRAGFPVGCRWAGRR